MGLAVGGSSIGGVIFSIALDNMLNNSKMSFGWSIRVIGFVMLAVFIPSVISIRARLPPRKKKFFLPRAFVELKFMVLASACFDNARHRRPAALPANLRSGPRDERLNGQLPPCNTKWSIVLRQNHPRDSRRQILWPLQRPLRRRNRKRHHVFLLATRDVQHLPRRLLSLLRLRFRCCALGLWSLFRDCTIRSTEYRHVPCDGHVSLVGISTLIGPPISGALIDRFGGYEQVSFFCGAVALVGGLLVIPVKILCGGKLMSKY